MTSISFNQPQLPSELPFDYARLTERVGESPVAGALREWMERASELLSLPPASSANVPVERFQWVPPIRTRPAQEFAEFAADGVISSAFILLTRYSPTTGSPQVYLQERVGAWRSGYYGPPGGHVEEGEWPIEAAIREVREEAGVRVKPRHLRAALLNLTDPDFDDRDPSLQRADYWYVAKSFNGEPLACEEDRAGTSGWFELSALADIPIVPKYRAVLTALVAGNARQGGQLHLTTAELHQLHADEQLRLGGQRLGASPLCAGVLAPEAGFARLLGQHCSQSIDIGLL